MIALIAITTMNIGACADVYKNVPYGYTTHGNETLTQEKVDWQDQHALPRCDLFAKETNPTRAEAALAYGFNHGFWGFASGAGGYYGEVKVIGAVLKLSNVGGVAVATAIPNGVLGGVSGWESASANIHATIKSCLINDAVGIHQIPPSIAKQIVESGKPQSFAAPWEWSSSKAPLTQMPDASTPQ